MTAWSLAGSITLAIGLAILAAGLCMWLYQRELSHAPNTNGLWILPALRTLAVIMAACTFAQPQLETLWQNEDPGRVSFLIDGSRSMSLTDRGSEFHTSRFGRAVAPVRQVEGRWSRVFSEAETSVFRGGDGGLKRLRDLTPLQAKSRLTGKPSSEVPATWLPAIFDESSPLGDQLLELARHVTGEAAVKDRAAIVLLTDGLANAGENLGDAAERLSELGIAVYPVGFGTQEKTSDLVAVDVIAPQSVFRTASVAGKLIVNDQLLHAAMAQVEIRKGEQIVWREEIQCSGAGQRAINFTFSAGDLIGIEGSSDVASQTVLLTASVSSTAAEVTLENNSRPFLINVQTRTSKVWLIDSLSRWETRYIKNLFSRDPTWELTAYIESVRDEAQTDKQVLPSTDELLQQDLVILGDIAAAAFTPRQLDDLVEFVSRGGGLIMIDGPMLHLHTPAYSAISKLIPVRWDDSSAAEPQTADRLDTHIELEPAGLALPALRLQAELESLSSAAEPDENAFWATLPKLNFVADCEAKEESEVLASVATSIERQPLCVTRRYGAGRVLYMASDQTWRWRYKTGDSVHGRLWSQLARWVERKPSRVKNDFVSLDASHAFAQAGTPVEIVCELLAARGDQSALGEVIASLRDASGAIVRRIRMLRSSTTAGNYTAAADDLPIGSFTVSIEADGYSADALNVRLPLVISKPPSSEMRVVSVDERALEKLANATGGVYLHESELDQLPERLADYRGSSVQSKIIQVWSTYYWFAAILCLLTIEWLLRKRFGLI